MGVFGSQPPKDGPFELEPLIPTSETTGWGEELGFFLLLFTSLSNLLQGEIPGWKCYKDFGIALSDE